jgi:hypothetical protein
MLPRLEKTAAVLVGTLLGGVLPSFPVAVFQSSIIFHFKNASQTSD